MSTVQEPVSEPSEWRPARLIPTSGIKSREDQEQRATSCLLAVMHAVPGFGHALLGKLGAPKSRSIDTFTEVRFSGADAKTVIPDGAIVCEWGKVTWRCLVEVKTAGAPLRPEQLSAYLDIARDNGFDGVLTISNDLTSGPTESPVTVDKRKLRRAKLWHLSWWAILTEALVETRYRGVSDPDQAWILNELIAYLESKPSGCGGFEDMGDGWVAVRKAARDGTLRANDPEARNVAERWQQFTEYVCLRLSQELGRTVSPVRPRNQAVAARVDETLKTLAATGLLETTFRIPDAAGPLTITSDLKARLTHTSVTVDAPSEGRPLTRINWLLRQLRGASDDLRVEVAFRNSRDTTSVLLAQARENPKCLLHPGDAQREPRRFVVTASRSMGQKRGKDEGSFVRETRTQALDFYRDLVQGLKPWRPKAPQVRRDAETDSEVARDPDVGAGSEMAPAAAI